MQFCKQHQDLELAQGLSWCWKCQIPQPNGRSYYIVKKGKIKISGMRSKFENAVNTAVGCLVLKCGFYTSHIETHKPLELIHAYFFCLHASSA